MPSPRKTCLDSIKICPLSKASGLLEGLWRKDGHQISKVRNVNRIDFKRKTEMKDCDWLNERPRNSLMIDVWCGVRGSVYF